ncbi:MAG: ABC transporter substrate-binding protein, partial [Roseovarius sp.]
MIQSLFNSGPTPFRRVLGLGLSVGLALQALPAQADGHGILDIGTWDDVVAQADGGTVNFYMWGGSDRLNGWVDEYLGDALMENYNVTLNRVPIADTAEVVNLLLAERQAGVMEDGTVDLIWINGDNYRTLRQADLLLGPWAEDIPNAVHIDWADPSIANDFGEPVEGHESPWGSAQFVFEYNSNAVTEPPLTIEALGQYIAENPGTFTYPAPPDFHGLSFVKHVLHWAAEDPSVLQEPFDQAAFDEIAPRVWEFLNEIEPNLWREGTTYPPSIAALQDLLANSEVNFSMRLDPSNAARLIAEGSYPPSIRTFVLETGTLANKNYVAIPANAPNAAAALLAANHIISPEFQLIMADPERWGWNIPSAVGTWSDEQRAQLAGYDRGEATLSFEELGAHTLPEPHASWISHLEEGWME